MSMCSKHFVFYASFQRGFSGSLPCTLWTSKRETTWAVSQTYLIKESLYGFWFFWNVIYGTGSLDNEKFYCKMLTTFRYFRKQLLIKNWLLGCFFFFAILPVIEQIIINIQVETCIISHGKQLLEAGFPNLILKNCFSAIKLDITYH